MKYILQLGTDERHEESALEDYLCLSQRQQELFTEFRTMLCTELGLFTKCVV
jgi:hypothetical protein